MQNLIQQLGVRAGALLLRRRSQAALAAELSTIRTGDVVITADEQIKFFNDLLHAVCRKLLAKIRELECVSAELNNLMKVCAVPAIFVDENLRVRSFTRESRRIYKLSHQDVGLSLLRIPCALDYHTVADDLRRAVETRKAVNRYLEHRGSDVRYFLRILPNFCRDNSFGGAALIFTQVEGRDWGTA